MIKIQPTVKDIIMSEPEAYISLTEGYMNMSSYAHRIRKNVESRTKKQITIASLVVTLSRLRKEFKKTKPLIQKVDIANITTKLPLSEIAYENTDITVKKLELLHSNISISREDFFTTTIGTSELTIVCSSRIAEKIIKYFKTKPKFVAHNLSSIGLSFSEKQFTEPNTIFSLVAVLAKARINIIEIVSTYTELLFILNEKDFSEAVILFSELHRESNTK